MKKIELLRMIAANFSLFFYSEDIFARSLKASADKLSQEASRVGLALGIFGLTMGGIYLIMGRQDANQKIGHAVVGIAILMLAPAIISFLKSII